MPSDEDDGRAFVYQKLGIGYFFLGLAPVFVIVDPQSIGSILLALVGGAITGAIAFGGFLLVAGRLMDAIAGIDVDDAEPTLPANYSTDLVIGLGALALLPVILWILTTVAPGEDVTGGGRRSPLGGALLVSAALMSVVAEPIWFRALQFTPVEAVK